MKIFVKIAGSSFETSIGSISKNIYAYWAEHDDALAQALQSPEDQVETPNEYKLNHFTEHSEILNVTGVDITSEVSLQINTEDGELLYESILDDLQDIFFDHDENKNLSEITFEFSKDDLSVGNYLIRTANGFHDIYFEEIDTGDDEFNITELKFLTKEIDGVEIISNIKYCGIEYEISEIQGDMNDEYFSLLEV